MCVAQSDICDNNMWRTPRTSAAMVSAHIRSMRVVLLAGALCPAVAQSYCPTITGQSCMGYTEVNGRRIHCRSNNDCQRLCQQQGTACGGYVFNPDGSSSTKGRLVGTCFQLGCGACVRYSVHMRRDSGFCSPPDPPSPPPPGPPSPPLLPDPSSPPTPLAPPPPDPPPTPAAPPCGGPAALVVASGGHVLLKSGVTLNIGVPADCASYSAS